MDEPKPQVDSEEELQAKLAERLAESEASIARSRAEAEQKLDAISQEFMTKQSDLGQRLEAAQKRKQKLEEAKIGEMIDRKTGRSLGVGLMVAYAILGMPLVGFLAGLGMQAAGWGSQWTGILGMIGFALGLGFAVFMLHRHQKD